MRDLVEDLTSFTCFQHVDVAYSFMLDAAGRYVYHPLLPLSTNKEEDPVYADFCMFERGESATVVRDSMIRGERNSTVLTTQHVTPRGTTQEEGTNRKRMNLNYYWGPIGETGFSVCVVLDDTDRYLQFSPASYPARVLYHRTDLSTDTPTKCNAFNRIVLKDNATVLLTESAFSTPGKYHSLENINAEDVDHIQWFLESGSPTDMHIKDEIRDSVAVLYGKLQEIWSSKRKDLEYTMARYVGTREGLFMQMPGVRYPHPYDHTKRTWYIKTLHSKYDSAIIGPYKDVPSGMNIATLTKTVTVPGNQTLGVVALDFSLYHLYHHFKKAYPQCDSELYVCTIIDDSGMVVLHKSFVDDPSSIDQDDPMQRYIVRKEQDVSLKLKELGVFSKHKCFNSKTDKRYQNFFKIELSEWFNGSVDGGFFTLHAVRGTNVFIIIRDASHTDSTDCQCLASSTCDPAFEDCPCPCDEEAEYDNCENQIPRNSDVPLPCFPDAPQYPFGDLAKEESKSIAKLPLCYSYDCSAHTTKLSCDGVFSCSWCNETSCEPDGKCVRENEAAPAPGEKTSGEVGEEEEGGGGVSREAMLGGVIAGGIVLILVVGVVVMCIRQRKANKKPESIDPEPQNPYDVIPHHLVKDRPKSDTLGFRNPYFPSVSDDGASTPSARSDTWGPRKEAPPFVPREHHTISGFGPSRGPPVARRSPHLPIPQPPCPVHGPSVNSLDMKQICPVHGIRHHTPGNEYDERPLPVIPPSHVFRKVRESSIYNTPQPVDTPVYMEAQHPDPPKPCPGVQNRGSRTPEQSTLRHQVELRPQNQILDTQVDGVDPYSVVPYYNVKKPRPTSVASSTDYGQSPIFQNSEVLDEIGDGMIESSPPTPIYENADKAEAVQEERLIASEAAEPMYGKIPKFENPGVFNEYTGDNEAYVTTEELENFTNERGTTYENDGPPLDEKHSYVNAWLNNGINEKSLQGVEEQYPEIDTDN